MQHLRAEGNEKGWNKLLQTNRNYLKLLNAVTICNMSNVIRIKVQSKERIKYG